MREPKQVKIPFLERFREPMLNGTKTMTSRTKIYGAKGDFFEAFSAEFRLDSVDAVPFAVIVPQWKAEGCSSRADFLGVWRQIHPRKVFEDNELLFVHRFHRVGQRRA